MTTAFTASDIRALSTTGDYDTLMARASDCYEQHDYLQAQMLSMAAALIATNSGDEEIAIHCAAHAMSAGNRISDPNPEQPAVLAPVRLSRGVPVYGPSGCAYYGEAPAGASWVRA
jgi:hypothetical protein